MVQFRGLFFIHFSYPKVDLGFIPMLSCGAPAPVFTFQEA